MLEYKFKKEVAIKSRLIKNFNRPFIISEIGNNHNQKFSYLKKMIDHSIKNRCEAVKFQLYKAEDLVSRDDKNYKIFKSNELNIKWVKKIKDYCTKKKILPFFSIFNHKDVKFLEKYNFFAYKIASSELLNFKLLEEVFKTKKIIFISTGMADDLDIIQALNFLNKKGARKVVLLLCYSLYPQNLEQCNLNLIDKWRKLFNDMPIGLSDHTKSIYTPAFAVSKGACVIEKHFTLNNSLKGPDHKTSLNPKNFSKMTELINLSFIANGSSIKKLDPLEKKFGRRNGLYFKNKISKGSYLTIDEIEIRRPRLGLAPSAIEKVVNRMLIKSAKKNEPINLSYF